MSLPLYYCDDLSRGNLKPRQCRYTGHHFSTKQRIKEPLFASLDGVVDGVVALLVNLRLEVQVHELILLCGPLAVRVAVVDNLVAASVADLYSRVGKGSVSVPLDVVAGVGDDGEGDGAALVLVGVEALLDGKVEDIAGGDCLGWRRVVLVEHRDINKVTYAL